MTVYPCRTRDPHHLRGLRKNARNSEKSCYYDERSGDTLLCARGGAQLDSSLHQISTAGPMSELVSRRAFAMCVSAYLRNVHESEQVLQSCRPASTCALSAPASRPGPEHIKSWRVTVVTEVFSTIDSDASTSSRYARRTGYFPECTRWRCLHHWPPSCEGTLECDVQTAIGACVQSAVLAVPTLKIRSVRKRHPSGQGLFVVSRVSRVSRLS
ncbi:hypothetical protein DFH11DRAFT_1547951 [Phellopilus nigrolimitatus]|nr:hypothetical protein DFH11DRAFT_1547951 [Phellopilus nigrolimitatus]